MDDRALIGLVRYGGSLLIGKRANIFKYMTTKRREYTDELFAREPPSEHLPAINPD